MQIAYYYRPSVLGTPQSAALHAETSSALSRLGATGRIADCVIADVDVAFPTEQAQQELFDRLRDFALRHKVGLARVFGSRRSGFCYLPQQFLLVLEGDKLQEVFPCEMGQGDAVEPLEFLDGLERNHPWTTRSARGMEGKKHKVLVAEILTRPDTLEPGLALRGENVQVSRDFCELGFIDLVFEDRDHRVLLVEVKVGVDELDKAIGQILRHRYLFAQQNQMDRSSIRVGIACPYISESCRVICADVGITCFELPKTLTANA
jgi:hypothetical protein